MTKKAHNLIAKFNRHVRALFGTFKIKSLSVKSLSPE